MEPINVSIRTRHHANNSFRLPARCGLADEIERIPHALKVAELAPLLNVSRMTLYREVHAQTVPYFRVRGAIRFDPRAVAEWLRTGHLRVA